MLTILKKLEDTSSTHEKLTILKKNVNNELLKRVVVAAIDPKINYFIKKIPDHVSSGDKDISYFLDNITKLSTREITGHAAITHLQTLLNDLSPEYTDLAVRIIRRDLRCGIQRSTANKVWDNIIPEFPCMLAQPSKEKFLKNIKFPAVSQEKSDGTRVTIVCADGIITAYTRAGREIHMYGVFDEDILRSEQTMPFVLDGELLVVDKNGEVLPRATGNGIIHKAVKGTLTTKEALRFRMVAWDCIPLVDFYNGFCSIPYSERFKRTQQVCNGKITAIQSIAVNNMEEADIHFQEMLSLGKEGTLLKNIDSPWENKRSNNQVKFKAEEEADLEVIGFNYGNPGTKWEHGLGSLICASSDRKVVVDVSGFEDDMRREIFQNFEKEWRGAIITVLYNSRVKSKGGKPTSLFLPRFVCKRFDKSVANSDTEIK